MNVSIEAVIAGGIAFLVLIVFGLWGILRLISVEARLGRVERGLGRQEEADKKANHDLQNLRMAVVGLATKESVSDVKADLGRIEGEVRASAQVAVAVQQQLSRVEGFLMETAAKRIAGVVDNGATS